MCNLSPHLTIIIMCCHNKILQHPLQRQKTMSHNDFSHSWSLRLKRCKNAWNCKKKDNLAKDQANSSNQFRNPIHYDLLSRTNFQRALQSSKWLDKQFNNLWTAKQAKFVKKCNNSNRFWRFPIFSHFSID